MADSDLFDTGRFGDGLVVGVLVLASIWILAGLASRRLRRDVAWPVAGIAIAIGTLAAADLTGPAFLASDRLRVGTLILLVGPGAAALLVRDARRAQGWAILAALPGALVIGWAAGLENDLEWAPPFIAFWTVAAGALVADADRHCERAGLGVILLPISALGMLVTLPDTEQALVLLGVVLPVALLGWPVVRASLGPGVYATVGLFAWVAAVGGRGRPGSVIGGAACIGVLLVEPVARRVWRGRARTPSSPRSARTALIAAVQVGTIAVLGRVAGLEESGASALAIALGTLVIATVVMVLLYKPRRTVAGGSEAERGARSEPGT